jgi:exopolysaccharide production protein ExoY
MKNELEMSSAQKKSKLRERKEISYIVSKRFFDILVSLLLLIVLLPIFVIIYILFQTGQNKGPVFFSQQRFGKQGRLFRIYKFRSMVVGADKKLKSNPELYKKYIENNYKLEPDEDPRITSLGRFLRKSSLDELPQLINVLKGEMSLVGPRPIVEEELKEYGNFKKEFLSVKPGVTGYWQASGRSEVKYPERVDIELFYIRNKSFFFDIKIIVLTIIAVVFGKGAY